MAPRIHIAAYRRDGECSRAQQKGSNDSVCCSWTALVVPVRRGIVY